MVISIVVAIIVTTTITIVTIMIIVSIITIFAVSLAWAILKGIVVCCCGIPRIASWRCLASAPWVTLCAEA